MGRYIVPNNIRDQVAKLRQKGLKHREIAEKLKLEVGTVKSICRKRGLIQDKRIIDVDALVKDRLVMSLANVAKKHKLSLFTVLKYTRDNPLVRGLRHSNSLPGSQPHMQKGHVKLQKNEKVFETKKQDFTRSVSMHDSKNTVLLIKSSDKRSNEQIRKEWLSKREGELRKVS